MLFSITVSSAVLPSPIVGIGLAAMINIVVHSTVSCSHPAEKLEISLKLLRFICQDHRTRTITINRVYLVVLFSLAYTSLGLLYIFAGRVSLIRTCSSLVITTHAMLIQV